MSGLVRGERAGGGGIPEPSIISCRGVGSYLKVGGQGVKERAQFMSPPFQININDLPKSGWAISHSTHPSPDYVIDFIFKNQFLIHDIFYLNSVFKSPTTLLS